MDPRNLFSCTWPDTEGFDLGENIPNLGDIDYTSLATALCRHDPKGLVVGRKVWCVVSEARQGMSLYLRQYRIHAYQVCRLDLTTT